MLCHVNIKNADYLGADNRGVETSTSSEITPVVVSRDLQILSGKATVFWLNHMVYT